MQKDRKRRDNDSASRDASSAPSQSQTSAQSLQRGAERKPAEASRSEREGTGASEGSKQEPRSPRRSGSDRASAGTPDLPRDRPSAGTPDIERGSGDPQESMVGDSTGAFKERP